MADIADRTVARLEKNGQRTILADRYEGKRLTGPNDIVVRSDGAVYFTDMPSGLRYTAKDPQRELPFNSVFVVKDGQIRLIDKDPFDIVPNGITLSPDEKYLYVGGTRRIVRYDVVPDGNAINGRLFVDMRVEKLPGGPDGIRTDQKGDLWTTGPGGLWVVSQEGKHIGTIRMPEGEHAISFAFGDPEKGMYKSVYIVTPSSLYRLRGVNIPVIQRSEQTTRNTLSF
jgi:gluconolactonase